jgi:hypothetical protein
MKHLKEANIGYTQHFIRAMSMSLALFVHAFYPNAFPTYASDKMTHEKCPDDNHKLGMK